MFEKIRNVLRRDTKPFFEKPRYPCPFYGFLAFGLSRHDGCFSAFADQGNNRCGLAEKMDGACKMEYLSMGPDWKKCPLNNKDNQESLDQVFRKAKIYPKEFRPPKVRCWKGMSIDRWRAYVMAPTTPRPVPVKMSETSAKAAAND